MRKILFIFLIFPFFIVAQSKNINGTVNDENGTPLPGATVQLKGSDTVGAITDFDGNFRFSTDKKSLTLKISYVGYESLEKKIELNLNGTGSIT